MKYHYTKILMVCFTCLAIYFLNVGSIHAKSNNFIYIENQNQYLDQTHFQEINSFYFTQNLDTQSKDDNNKTSNKDENIFISLYLKLTTKFGPVLYLIPALFIATLPVYLFMKLIGRKQDKKFKEKYTKAYIRFNIENQVLPNDIEIPYYREYPCFNDFQYAYLLSYIYQERLNEQIDESLISAIILSWVKEGRVSITKAKEGLMSFNDGAYAIDLSTIEYTTSETLNQLIDMLKAASGKNLILEYKELNKWSRKHFRRVLIWIDQYTQEAFNEGIKKQYIKSYHIKVPVLFFFLRTETKYRLEPDAIKEAIRLIGFKKFLLEFTTMKERDVNEIHIFEEHLIYATLLGVSNQVKSQLVTIHPDLHKKLHSN